VPEIPLILPKQPISVPEPDFAPAKEPTHARRPEFTPSPTTEINALLGIQLTPEQIARAKNDANIDNTP
jgi:hypothetical protein